MQSEPGRNYFDLFDLPVSFDVDNAVLTEHYRELQRRVHPDKFANATDRERRLSVQQAALINEAFQVLKSPLSRARYLLGLHGLEINDESNTVMDGAFLMQQMELRESLEEIGDRRDLDALGGFMDDVAAQRKALVKRLAELFADAGEGQLAEAHKLTLQMQFLDKLLAEAGSLEESMF
ncbi:MAG: Fe-S protein assembly co-chaperone HscB [Granulosicoccaceae bacterium]|jgi:molecular chaperone HscB